MGIMTLLGLLGMVPGALGGWPKAARWGGVAAAAVGGGILGWLVSFQPLVEYYAGPWPEDDLEALIWMRQPDVAAGWATARIVAVAAGVGQAFTWFVTLWVMTLRWEVNGPRARRWGIRAASGVGRWLVAIALVSGGGWFWSPTGEVNGAQAMANSIAAAVWCGLGMLGAAGLMAAARRTCR